MTRERLAWLGVLGVAIALVAWVANHTYWTDTQVPMPLKGEALTVASDPTEPLMAAGGTRSPVRIWRRDTGAPAASIDVGASWVYSVAFSPDGSVLAITVDHTGGNLESASGPVAGVVRFIDPHTGRDIGDPISYDNGPPISLSWSPDGRLLAVATADNFLHV